MALCDFDVFTPYVSTAEQLVSVGIALGVVVTGKAVWAPRIPWLPHYSTRIFGVVAGIGLAYLYIESRSVIDAPRFAAWAWTLVAIGVIGACVYLGLRLLLCFKCRDDPTQYVKGLRLNQSARRVLAGERQGLPQQYSGIPEPGPVNDEEFFCGSGKNKNFI